MGATKNQSKKTTETKVKKGPQMKASGLPKGVAPSDTQQAIRTTHNKADKFAKDKAMKAHPKILRVKRGTARAKRRFGVGRKGSAVVVATA